MRAGKYWLIGYSYAVVGASITCGAMMVGSLALHGELFSARPEFTELVTFLIWTISFLLLLMIVAFFTAIVPAYAVQKVAQRYLIQSVSYYILCGGLTAFALYVLMALVLSHDPYPGANIPVLIPAMSVASTLAIPCGIVGGLIYWWFTGRFVNSQPRQAPAPAPNP